MKFLSASFPLSSPHLVLECPFSTPGVGEEKWVSPAMSSPAGIARHFPVPLLERMPLLDESAFFFLFLWGRGHTIKISYCLHCGQIWIFFFSPSACCWKLPWESLHFCKFPLLSECRPGQPLLEFCPTWCEGFRQFCWLCWFFREFCLFLTCCTVQLESSWVLGVRCQVPNYP